jgi:glycosyltransferase involved in cell wall biosynthesis
MRTSSKAINRGLWSLRCSRGNCPRSVPKPCWLHGQFGRNRPVGVDVVGYLQSENGLGEASRLMVRALDAANIPVGLISVPLPGHMSETSIADRLSSANRHSLALSILPAAGIADFARRTCRGQENVAYPFWELPTFPKSWRQAFDGFDAYWAPTTFVRDVLLDYQDRPVYLIPQPVFVPDVPPEPQTFRAPLKIYTFFDFDSFMSRKNPMGAIHAFRAAFPKGTEDVSLVIKARGTPQEQDRQELYALAHSDPRIQVREKLLSRAEMSALMADCNVFLSLHRSEGFGLGCAEALALGKIVVATDFGGTRDFISVETGYPVSFKQVSLRPDDYPGAEGSYWAEPDIGHATSILQGIYAEPGSTTARSVAGFRHLQRNNSFEAVGRVIRAYLDRDGAPFHA